MTPFYSERLHSKFSPAGLELPFAANNDLLNEKVDTLTNQATTMAGLHEVVWSG